QLLVLGADLALHQIAEGGDAFVRHAEAHHGARGSLGDAAIAAGPRILESALFPRRLLAQLVELLLGADAAVGAPAGDQLAGAFRLRGRPAAPELGRVRARPAGPSVRVETGSVHPAH